MTVDRAPLLEALGVDLPDDLLTIALTHRSYAYENGVNRRAIVVLILSILPVVPGFLRAALTPGGVVAEPNIWDHLYTYAWFVTFGLSFLAYLSLKHSTPRSRL